MAKVHDRPKEYKNILERFERKSKQVQTKKTKRMSFNTYAHDGIFQINPRNFLKQMLM